MVDRPAMGRAQELFDRLCADHLARPGVDIGPMFSTHGLRIHGKVYAFVGHDDDFIVKLPAARIDELIADGVAQRMRMRDREMREWAVVPWGGGARAWSALADEAHAFVGSLAAR